MKLVLSRPDRWLALLIAASLVLPPVFFGLVAYQSRMATLTAANERLMSIVDLLREHAQKVLDTDELAIQQVEQLTAGMSWDEIAQSRSLHEKLKQLDDQLAQIRGIYLITPNGTVASSSRAFPASPVNIAGRDYFVALRDRHQGAFISKVYRGFTSGTEQFNVARRRASPDGTFNGVIDISDSPIYFEEAYQGIGNNNTASVVLARDDGEVLASYPTPMFSGSRAPADLIARLPQKGPLLVEPIPSPFDATARVGAYQRVHGYPLFVGYSLPVAFITAVWHRNVVLNGAIIGIGSLTVAFMGWLVLRGVRMESAAHVAFREEVRKREQAEARMEQARRLEVIGQLTAGVAHDFSNLLAVVSGNIERLVDGTGSDKDARVEAALSAIERGDSLIRQMLTFARRQVLDPDVVDINAGMRAFAPLLAAVLKKNIEVDYRLPSNPLVCRIDRAEFEFAILNVATNARHAMPHGGRLEITVEQVRVIDDVIDGLDLTAGAYARVAFKDTGEGMTPEVLAHAFEPFFTTRAAGAGTGLGLSQVYGFAKQSGGLATVDSDAGRGITVTMYLPLLETEAVGEAGRALTSVS